MLANKDPAITKRDARRLARIARWDRPLGDRLDRTKAWLNMLFVDHGFLRLVYLNVHPVGSGGLWRSAQPTPRQIARLRRKGIRSIVTLRGQRGYGSWPLERAACEALGIRLHEINVQSRAAPRRETVLELKRLYETIEYPALIHCKSGADRAGLAAALYLVFREGAHPAEALRQLSFRYGHVRFAKTGILRRFLEAYLAHAATEPMSFEDWVATRYDPAALRHAQPSSRLWNLVVDSVLRRE